MLKRSFNMSYKRTKIICRYPVSDDSTGLLFNGMIYGSAGKYVRIYVSLSTLTALLFVLKSFRLRSKVGEIIEALVSLGVEEDDLRTIDFVLRFLGDRISILDIFLNGHIVSDFETRPSFFSDLPFWFDYHAMLSDGWVCSTKYKEEFLCTRKIE